jgi:hypothetical protein
MKGQGTNGKAETAAVFQAAATTGGAFTTPAGPLMLLRLAVVAAALGAVVTIWAVVYTYVWPGVPASPASTPPIVLPDHAPAVAEILGDRLPDELPFAQYVYNVNSDKIGQIAAVMLGNDRKIDLYIVSVGDWFLDGSEKNIAVPSQKLTWVKGQNYSTKQYEWTPVVAMTKADVQNAPKQIFDPAAKKWVPAQ